MKTISEFLRVLGVIGLGIGMSFSLSAQCDLIDTAPENFVGDFNELPVNAETDIDLVEEIESIVNDMPGKTTNINKYRVPTDEERYKWYLLMEAIFNNNLNLAAGIANSIQYKLQLVKIEDPGRYILILKNIGENYWGTYIWSFDPLRDKVIIQAPHALADAGTADQGIKMFKNLRAKVFMMNGTHRCNSNYEGEIKFSECTGETAVCNQENIKEKYRTSDMAHNCNSIFHLTTIFLEEKLNKPYFIQLHRFGKKEFETIDFVISNGTLVSSANGEETDILENLEHKLISNNFFPKIVYKEHSYTFSDDLCRDESSTTECNECDPKLHTNCVQPPTPSGEPSSWRVRGLSNTQGRYINGTKGDPCTKGDQSPNGRFMHLEQEGSIFANDGQKEVRFGLIEQTFAELFPPNLITENPIPSGEHQFCEEEYVSTNILFSNTVIEHGSSVSLFAEGKIILEEGFWAKSGSIFSTTIATCHSTATATSTTSSFSLNEDSKFLIPRYPRIFPNPITGNYLKVRLHPDMIDQEYTFQLVDLWGNMRSGQILNFHSSQELSLDMNGLSPGEYWLKIQKGKTITYERIRYNPE